MIAFITRNSNLVPLLEGLCTLQSTTVNWWAGGNSCNDKYALGRTYLCTPTEWLPLSEFLFLECEASRSWEIDAELHLYSNYRPATPWHPSSSP